MDIDIVVVGAISGVIGYALSRIRWRRVVRQHRWVDDVTVQTTRGKLMRQNCADCPATRFKPS